LHAEKEHSMLRSVAPALSLAGLCLASSLVPVGAALAQAPGGGAPPVGVEQVHRQPVTSTAQYIGRIQAIDSVALIPRVTAYLEKRLFQEGTEVKKGDLLYVLEQGPFQAAVLAQQGTLAQAQANIQNARVNFQRQKSLLSTPAGQRQAYDNALATQQSGVGNVLTAQGNLQTAQIQLGYTEIRAPVDGRISATSVNEGNVVSPSSGALATIVTQDPMYVVFPVATRDLIMLEKKYGAVGGLGNASIKLVLADGSTYDQMGKLDYVSPTVSNQTDTITLRATVPNPKRGDMGTNASLPLRQLVTGEFVTVVVEDPKPVDRAVIPRAAVLSDQQGDYVFTVDGQNHVRRTSVKLGEDVGANVAVLSGLSDGQSFIVDGIQKVHEGEAVSPVAPQPVVPDPGQTPPNTSSTNNAQSGQGAANKTKTGSDAAAFQGSPSPTPAGGTTGRH